jgi:AcrR family transcriptional regulator
MGKPGEGSKRTTAATRRAIQQSNEGIRSIARRYGVDPKTVAKWRRRVSTDDYKAGPRLLGSSVLAIEEEAMIVAFRRFIVLPLDECLHGLRAFIPRLTRSSLHRCLQRHGISRRPAALGEPLRETAEDRAAGCFDLGFAEVTVGGVDYPVFIAVEHSSKFVFAELHEAATRPSTADFLQRLIRSAPCGVRALTTTDGRSSALYNEDRTTRRGPAVADLCVIHEIEFGQIAAWSDEQQRKIEQTIGAALTRRCGEGGGSVQGTFAAVIAAYNRNCRLDALKGLAPEEFVAKQARAPAAPLRGAHTGKADRARPGAHKSAAATRTARRAKNPEVTREAILQAARSRLAHDGPEGLSLAEVARVAGVNRGTAYQHFETRDKLIAATAEWVSEKLYYAVFGDPKNAAERPNPDVDVAERTDRLANFAMDNPELCRIWLLKVLSSPDPASDMFWREYEGSTARFARTDRAKEHVDSEVLSVIMLAGAFLWPVWARSKSKSSAELRPLAHRFAQECLRISMYGNLRSELYPAVAQRLRSSISDASLFPPASSRVQAPNTNR